MSELNKNILVYIASWKTKYKCDKNKWVPWTWRHGFHKPTTVNQDLCL